MSDGGVGHVIFNLHLGVGHSIVLQLEGVGHVFSNHPISKCFSPPPPPPCTFWPVPYSLVVVSIKEIHVFTTIAANLAIWLANLPW